MSFLRLAFSGNRLLDAEDLPGDTDEFFRVFELFTEFLHKLRRKIPEVILRKSRKDKVAGDDVVDFSVVIGKRAV